MSIALIIKNNPTATDAEIAALANALTVSAIDTSAVRFWLSQQGLVLRSARTQTLTGTLITFLETLEALPSPTAGQQVLMAGLNEFINHVYDDKMASIATHENTWALKAEGLLEALLAEAVITEEQHQQFHNLDGGLLVPGGATTEADVAAVRATMAAEAAAQANWATFANAWNTHMGGTTDGAPAGSTIPDMTAFQAALNNLNTQVQAL